MVDHKEEMLRKFGVKREPYNFDKVCTVCGKSYGEHFGAKCPRDKGKAKAKPVAGEPK